MGSIQQEWHRLVVRAIQPKHSMFSPSPHPQVAPLRQSKGVSLTAGYSNHWLRPQETVTNLNPRVRAQRVRERKDAYSTVCVSLCACGVLIVSVWVKKQRVCQKQFACAVVRAYTDDVIVFDLCAGLWVWGLRKPGTVPTDCDHRHGPEHRTLPDRRSTGSLPPLPRLCGSCRMQPCAPRRLQRLHSHAHKSTRT